MRFIQSRQDKKIRARILRNPVSGLGLETKHKNMRALHVLRE
jgi:hypothetical protein